MSEILQVNIVNKSVNQMPAYAREGDAGMDICSNEEFVLAPLERKAAKTGLFTAIPAGYECQIRPRSGAAIKQGLTVLNAPGTIDSGYRGEIGVILINLSNESIEIKVGDRVAQMVFAKHETVAWNAVSELDNTERGDGGFGHTGK